jgi:hypothetical protein
VLTAGEGLGEGKIFPHPNPLPLKDIILLEDKGRERAYYIIVLVRVQHIRLDVE